MKRAPVVLAALVVSGVVIAGGFGVGSGGLQGPLPVSVSGSGAQLGPGCITTATGIYCTTVDAGVINAEGAISSSVATGNDGIRCVAEGCRVRIGPDTYLHEVGTALTAVGTGGFTAPSLQTSGTANFSGSTTLQFSGTDPIVYSSNANTTTKFESACSDANCGATAATAVYTVFPDETITATDILWCFGAEDNASCNAHVEISGRIDTVSGYELSTRLTDTATAPTVTACSGGTAATMTWSNGNANFRFDVGTACTSESTAVVTLPAVANCWTCNCWNVGVPGTNLKQSACTTTTATITNYAATFATATDWTDSADVQCACRGG